MLVVDLIFQGWLRALRHRSLEQAVREAPKVASDTKFHARDLLDAMRGLAPLQRLTHTTRSVHAAAFWRPSVGIGPVREDVGRHNALDKVAGALMRDAVSRRSDGVLTSRVSVELVQKTAMIGAPMLVAVSAPTTLAIRTADAAGITLVAIARDDGYEVFTHPDRIVFPPKPPLPVPQTDSAAIACRSIAGVLAHAIPMRMA